MWSSEGSTYCKMVMNIPGSCSPFSSIMIAFCIAWTLAAGSLPSKPSLISFTEEGLSKCTCRAVRGIGSEILSPHGQGSQASAVS